jgi:hypothetical protein
MEVDYSRFWERLQLGEEEALYLLFLMFVITVSLAVVGINLTLIQVL